MPTPEFPTELSSDRCAPHPAHIHQIGAGEPLRDVHTLVPRALLSVTLAEPTPSGSTGASRLCQGCSHPSRHLPGQAALSFTALLRQGRRCRSFTSTQIVSASRRTWIRAQTSVSDAGRALSFRKPLRRRRCPGRAGLTPVFHEGRGVGASSAWSWVRLDSRVLRWSQRRLALPGCGSPGSLGGGPTWVVRRVRGWRRCWRRPRRSRLPRARSRGSSTVAAGHCGPAGLGRGGTGSAAPWARWRPGRLPRR